MEDVGVRAKAVERVEARRPTPRELLRRAMDSVSTTSCQPGSARALRPWRAGGPTLLLLLSLLLPAVASAQTGSVGGRVRTEDGRAIEGALARLYPVADSTQEEFTLTNALGFFAFRNVAAGDHVLTVTLFGFGDYREELNVAVGATQRVDIALAIAPIAVEGLTVEADRSRARTRFEESAGITVQEIESAALKSIPVIAESDPLRAIEVLPGVTSVSDFSASFNVRGGSADQNLILLDEVPIFSPFHLGNIFSVFNADMVERVELQSGGFPAEYGGRVSSVLTIASDPGDGDFGVDAGVSVLATRVAVKGQLPQGAAEKMGFTATRARVSARRSYLDLLIKPVAEFPYHLTDLQGVFEAWTEGGSRLRFVGYSGRDIVDLSGISDTPIPIRWWWGNDAIGGSWTQSMDGGTSLAVRTSFSRFRSDLGFPEVDTEFQTGVEQATIGADIEHYPSWATRWKSGVAVNRVAYDNGLVGGGATFLDQKGSGVEVAAYSQVHWDPTPDWLVEGGVRADYWRPNAGETQATLSPRFAVRRFLRGRSSAVRLAAGRYSQFIHSTRDEEFPFGLDTWVLAGEEAPRVVSDQVQVGAESFFGDDDSWFASLEAYYRTFDGVASLNAADDPNDDSDALVAGDGTAYGVDFYLKRDRGTTTGWLSVSFLKTDRSFPDTRVGIEPQPWITYPPVFDRRFEIDLVLRRPLDWWGLEAGVRANFGSGLPYTRPLGTFHIYRTQFVTGVLDADDGDAVVLGPRNGSRYPPRHRLDLSLRKTITRSWGTMTPYLSVINVYNQKNVLFYFFDYQASPPKRQGVSMIPFLPTIGFEVSF